MTTDSIEVVGPEVHSVLRRPVRVDGSSAMHQTPVHGNCSEMTCVDGNEASDDRLAG